VVSREGIELARGESIDIGANAGGVPTKVPAVAPSARTTDTSLLGLIERYSGAGLFARGPLQDGDFFIGQAVECVDVAVDLLLQRRRVGLGITVLCCEDLPDQVTDLLLLVPVSDDQRQFLDVSELNLREHSPGFLDQCVVGTLDVPRVNYAEHVVDVYASLIRLSDVSTLNGVPEPSAISVQCCAKVGGSLPPQYFGRNFEYILREAGALIALKHPMVIEIEELICTGLYDPTVVGAT
jgi:hypothetical protein